MSITVHPVYFWQVDFWETRQCNVHVLHCFNKWLSWKQPLCHSFIATHTVVKGVIASILFTVNDLKMYEYYSYWLQLSTGYVIVPISNCLQRGWIRYDLQHT